MITAIYFFGANRTWPDIVVLIIGAAIVLLLIQAISRLAYYVQKSHLVLLDMQADLKKLVMLRVQDRRLHPPEVRETKVVVAPPAVPADQQSPDA